MEFNKPDPLNLSEGNISDKFKQFKEEIDIYFIATKTTKESKEIQLARLKNLLGTDGLKLYNSIKDESVVETVENVMKTLEKHCVPKQNMTMSIHLLFSRKQLPHENFDSFYADLRNLIRCCKFEEQEEKILRALIILGVNNKELQEKLLREDTSFDRVINFCKASELAEKNVRLVNNKGKTDQNNFEVDTVVNSKFTDGQGMSAIRRFNQQQQQGYNTSQGGYNRQVGKTNNCYRCGGIHHGMCPAIGRICKKCGKPNHFASVCRNNNKFHGSKQCNNLQNVCDNSMSVEDNHESDINSLCVVDSIKNKNAWYKTLLVEGKEIKFKLDSGADVNVLPFRYLRNLNLPSKLKPCNTTLQSFGGFSIKPCGIIDVQIETDQKIDVVSFLIVKNENTVPILGLETCIKFNLLKRIDSVRNENGGNTDLEKEKLKIFEENKDVFEGLGCFPDKCKIKIKEGAQPTISTARRLPLKIKDKFKETLDSLVKRGIIQPVEEPVNWVSNVVVVEKPNGSLRICIDPIELNKNIVQEKFTIPTLNEISPMLNNKTHFSILDLKDGFYHVRLDEESSNLCSFATVFGTYKFLRAPFGLSCMPEMFQRLVSKYFGDIPGVSVYFDDLCIASRSKEENDEILEQVFERARKYNIKFNLSKFQYCKSEVKYLGVKFSKEGMSPDPDKIDSIKKLVNPTNKTELQRMLGMINYLRSFIPNVSELTAPLRELLKKNVVWNWTQSHSKVLEDLKTIICSSQVLAPFDPDIPVEIQCDASKDAIGFCMLQNGKPVHFGSRSMNNTEQDYAQIEKEQLAICFAVKKLHTYIYGLQDVVVFTDHLPLVSIAVKPLGKIVNNRLKRLKLKLIDYQLKVKYLPGRYMYIADFMSRCGIKTNEPKDVLMDDFVHTVEVHEITEDEPRLKLFQSKTKSDNILTSVSEYLHNCWPDPKVLEGEIKHFFNIRQDLQVNDDLIYYGERLVVPKSLRKFVLDTLHETHLGSSKINKKMKQLFYWPGMTSDVINVVSTCKICQKFGKSKTRSPMMNHDIPNIPFSKIAVDIAEFQRSYYLVIVDYYSRWIEALKISSKSSSVIISKLKEVFSRFGIPRTLIADNMPFNSIEFKQFSQEWNVTIITTSPYYPQSNGLVEKSVGIVKEMLKKCQETKQDLQLYLLNYRNSPISNLEVSPAQLLNSRHLRSKIPMREELLKPKLVEDSIYEKMIETQKAQKSHYDRKSLNREDSFTEGQEVWVQDVFNKTWDEGVIEKKLQQPRSYLVSIKDKGIKRRNNRFIKKRLGLQAQGEDDK